MTTQVKCKARKKFSKKISVRLGIDPKGMTLPVFQCGGLGIGSKLYTKKGLLKNQTHIEGNYKGENVIFWSDLVPSHYTKDTLEISKKKSENTNIGETVYIILQMSHNCDPSRAFGLSSNEGYMKADM